MFSMLNLYPKVNSPVDAGNLLKMIDLGGAGINFPLLRINFYMSNTIKPEEYDIAAEHVGMPRLNGTGFELPDPRYTEFADLIKRDSRVPFPRNCWMPGTEMNKNRLTHMGFDLAFALPEMSGFLEEFRNKIVPELFERGYVHPEGNGLPILDVNVLYRQKEHCVLSMNKNSLNLAVLG